MKMPWQDRTGLAKAIAFLATALIVSLGLCGTNFFAVIFFVPLGGPGPQPGIPEPSHWPADVLTATGTIELIAIAGSLIGLVVVMFIAIYRSVVQHFSGH